MGLLSAPDSGVPDSGVSFEPEDGGAALSGAVADGGGELTATWMWLVRDLPVVDALVRWTTFAVGGVGVAALVSWRAVHAFRSARLLYVGDRQFTLPFVERHVHKG